MTSSARSYSSAVRQLHVINGFSHPLQGSPRIPLVLKGLKPSQEDNRSIETQITALVLLSITYQLDFTDVDRIMFWVASCLAFFGFLRCSEFTVPDSGFAHDTHLWPPDISVNKNPSTGNVFVNIETRKLTSLRVAS